MEGLNFEVLTRVCVQTGVVFQLYHLLEWGNDPHPSSSGGGLIELSPHLTVSPAVLTSAGLVGCSMAAM